MLLEMKLKRFELSPNSTIGELFIDGKFICYTLEDTVREIVGRPVEQWKVPGKTAIPAGKYKVILSMSNRFKKILPEILGVPGFTGVRMHSGNKPEDTEGCLIVGLGHTKDFVSDSVKAFNKLFPILEEADETHKKITICIS